MVDLYLNRKYSMSKFAERYAAERRFYVYLDDEFFVLKVNEKCQQSYNRLMIHFLVFGN